MNPRQRIEIILESYFQPYKDHHHYFHEYAAEDLAYALRHHVQGAAVYQAIRRNLTGLDLKEKLDVTESPQGMAEALTHVAETMTRQLLEYRPWEAHGDVASRVVGEAEATAKAIIRHACEQAIAVTK